MEKTKKLSGKVIAIIAVALVLAIAGGLLVAPKVLNKPEPEVITVSTLEKIINVSELSTFTAVYNGICSSDEREKA